jgi:hypothetical protein
MPQNVLNAVPIKLIVNNLELHHNKGVVKDEPCTFSISNKCYITLPDGKDGNKKCYPATGLNSDWFKKVWENNPDLIVLHLTFNNCKRDSFRGEILNQFLRKFSTNFILVGRFEIKNEESGNKKLIVAFQR